MFLDRTIRHTVGVLAVLWVLPATAQENLYANKSPAQIFASDCSICHKTPQSLAKAGGPLGLGFESFLRSHYTASRESAALLAKYIQAMDAPSAPAEKAAKRSGTGAKKSDRPAAKKGDTKAGDAMPGDNKPVPASDSKPAEAKPAEAPKPAEAKPAEPKPEKSE